MSPRRSWKERGIPAAKVTAAYRLHRSTRKVGQLLGLSYKTIATIIREAKPDLLQKSGGSALKGRKRSAALHGTFSKWVKAHPDTRFPLDLDKIVKLTGCTKNSIKCFLYRQRKAGKPIPYLRDRRRKME